MHPLTEKEKKFLAKWKTIREHKTRYVVREGIVWSVPVALLSYFCQIDFTVPRFEWLHFLVRASVFMAGGLLWGYWLFRSNEKRYKAAYRRGRI